MVSAVISHMRVKSDYEIIRGDTHDLADVSDFLGMIRRLSHHAAPELTTFFDPRDELTIARAPGKNRATIANP